MGRLPRALHMQAYNLHRAQGRMALQPVPPSGGKRCYPQHCSPERAICIDTLGMRHCLERSHRVGKKLIRKISGQLYQNLPGRIGITRHGLAHL